MSDLAAAVSAHYSQPGLSASILSALAACGVDLAHVTVDDLKSFDEFHIGGVESTRELARFAQLTPGLRVIDLGCGIGGPARTLAREFGCHVRGIDLVAEFVAAANLLTRLVGLDHAVTCRQADMTQWSVSAELFEIAWSQHTTMNVSDKLSLFTSIHRVLVDGGRYVLHEVCTGSGEDVLYPVPWAESPAISFLCTADALQEQLRSVGFHGIAFADTTSASLDRLSAARAAAKPQAGSLTRPNQRLLMGDLAPDKVRNLSRNLSESRIRFVQILATK